MEIELIIKKIRKKKKRKRVEKKKKKKLIDVLCDRVIDAVYFRYIHIHGR